MDSKKYKHLPEPVAMLALWLDADTPGFLSRETYEDIVASVEDLVEQKKLLELEVDNLKRGIEIHRKAAELFEKAVLKNKDKNKDKLSAYLDGMLGFGK